MGRMKTTNAYCITSDVDWATDYCVEEMMSILSSYGVRPTIFATHSSQLIRRYITQKEIEIGVHPNFLPGSTHGADYHSVIATMFDMYPEAETFRSHCFVDSTPILGEMSKSGIRYDSNICLYLQKNIVPLNLAMGITRFPVFWEDDVHWKNSGGDWDFTKYQECFLSPGLKIFNFHPFSVAANVPNQDYYNHVKGYITKLSKGTIEGVRFDGLGAGTFLTHLLEYLTCEGKQFYTLGELYDMFPVDDYLSYGCV